MFLSAKQREEEHQAMLIRQANLEEMLRRAREREGKDQSESITDQEMVDSFFGFLPILGQEEPVAGGYEVGNPVRSITFLVNLAKRTATHLHPSAEHRWEEAGGDRHRRPSNGVQCRGRRRP